MKKYFKWGVLFVIGVAIALCVSFGIRTYLAGNENERKAIAQGFVLLPDLAANPRHGIVVEHEPTISRIFAPDLMLAVQDDPSLIPLCLEILERNFPPDDQVERLTEDTEYVFPEFGSVDDDRFRQAKNQILALAGNLVFRSFVRVAQRDFNSAIKDINLANQIAQNLRKSPNLLCVQGADSQIMGRALLRLKELAVNHAQDREIIEYVRRSLELFSDRDYLSSQHLINWQANAQISTLGSKYFKEESENYSRIGPITLPVPRNLIREEVFAEYLANLSVSKGLQEGTDEMFVAISNQCEASDEDNQGGLFWASEFIVLGANGFKFLVKVRQDFMILQAFLNVIDFEFKNQRLPSKSEIALPNDILFGFNLQYLQIPVPGRSRPRVLIVSPESDTPFIYQGSHLFLYEPHALESDPHQKKEKLYFRKDGSVIYSSNPEHPDYTAPAYGPGTLVPPKTPVIVR